MAATGTGAGILCCLGGAVFYFCGWASDRSAVELESILRVKQLKDLESMLRFENRLVVLIRGKVCSETPIECKFGGLRVVVVEQWAERHFLRRQDDKWIKASEFIDSSTRSPMAVKDDTGKIRIQRPNNGTFYVSPSSIDELIRGEWRWASFFVCASFALTAFGVYWILADYFPSIREQIKENAMKVVKTRLSALEILLKMFFDRCSR